jgi:NAD(P)-dependent dehydrogenase (short-subunit alcohol dehydrogenase family)
VPDLVINNAGVCIRQGEEEGDGDHEGEGEAANARRAAYEQSLAVNTWGPVRLLTEVCLPRMRRRGYVGQR